MNGYVKYLAIALVAGSVLYLRAVATELGVPNLFTVVAVIVFAASLRQAAQPTTAVLDTGSYPRLR